VREGDDQFIDQPLLAVGAGDGLEGHIRREELPDEPLVVEAKQPHLSS
jgi:hypothetical protein